MGNIVELLEALHAGGLAVIEAYIDESESARHRPRLFVVAGWYGEGAVWREIEGRWKEAIAEAGVSEFHSADCLGGYKEYAAISAEDRGALRWKLIEILKSYPIRGVSSEITLDETAGPVKKRREYAFCLFECMATMGVYAEYNAPPGQRIAFIVDERAKHTDELHRVRRALRETREAWGTPSRIGPAAFDNGLDVVPLQAADLLAHEFHLQRLGEIEGHAPLRPEFLALKPQVHRTVAHWDQANRRLHDYDNLEDDATTPMDTLPPA